MIAENLEKNIQLLPEYLQLEVSDYVEYLLIKYQVQQNQQDIPDEHKKILRERYKKLLENPAAGESWDTVKKELMQKYAI